MSELVLVGRILFSLLFLGSAVNHLTRSEAMAGYAAAKGVPAARAATLGSGVLLLAGTVSVLLGIWADLGALLLAVFLGPTAVVMHRFWQESDQQTRQMETIQFLKDLALCGACLMLLALFAHAGHGLGLMVTRPLFHMN